MKRTAEKATRSAAAMHWAIFWQRPEMRTKPKVHSKKATATMALFGGANPIATEAIFDAWYGDKYFQVAAHTNKIPAPMATPADHTALQSIFLIPVSDPFACRLPNVSLHTVDRG